MMRRVCDARQREGSCTVRSGGQTSSLVHKWRVHSGGSPLALDA